MEVLLYLSFLILPLKTVEKSLAVKLSKAMKKQADMCKFFDNEIMRACKYLDPRFKNSLCDDEQKAAINYLVKVYLRDAELKFHSGLVKVLFH